MTLSILICSIPSRFESLKILYDKLLLQAEGKPVEILVFMDNRKRTIGEKRTDIVRLARGKYFALLDDDDDCSDDYIDELLKAAESDCDILSFNQKAIVWGKESLVVFSLENDNEEFNPGGITKRKPFPCCGFKTEKFRVIIFGVSNWGEDMVFAQHAWSIATSEHHIDKTLHTYISSEVKWEEPV